MQEQLQQLRSLKQAQKDFLEAHKDVFSTYDEITTTIQQAEEDIKKIARETKQEMATEGIVVKVIRRFSKWYEYTALKPAVRKLLETKDGIKHEVVKEVFETLVRDGEITQEDRAKAFREEELSTSVSIQYAKS